MKRKKISFERKLNLNKETVTALNNAQTGYVIGGGTGASDCLACHTQPALSCAQPCNTQLICPTQPSNPVNCCVAETNNCPTLQSCNACPKPTVLCP